MQTITRYGDGKTKNPSTYDVFEGNLTDQTNWNYFTTGLTSVMKNKPAHHLWIRTDTTITLKLNSTTASGITIASTDSGKQFDDISLTNLFITNTGTAAVKIMTW
jgi:hypothetical protein